MKNYLGNLFLIVLVFIGLSSSLSLSAVAENSNKVTSRNDENGDGGGGGEIGLPISKEYLTYLSKENVANYVTAMLQEMDKFLINLNKNKYLAIEEIDNEIKYNKYLKEKLAEIARLDKELIELREKYDKWFNENEEIKSNYESRYLANEYKYFKDRRKQTIDNK